MLLGTNNNYNYTQPDQQLPPSSMAVTTSPSTKSLPTVLKLLLIFVILQLLIIIGIMVVLIVFGYIGYNGTNALVVDQLNCNNYYKLFQYENRQSYFMKITFTTTCISILLTIILLILTIKSSYQSVKLPDHVYPQQSSKSLRLSTLYIAIGSKTRPCFYIIQSVCLLCILVVLGYYLIVYLQFNNNSCQFTNNTDTMLHILIVWVIAVVGFIIGWIVWIIIVVINIKNRLDYVQQVKQKQEYKEYNTQMDNTKKQLIREQEKPTQNSPGKRIVYGYYDPVEHKYQEPVENQKNQLRKVGTLDSQKQQQVRPYRGVIDYYQPTNIYQSNQKSYENKERRIIQPDREDRNKYKQNQRKIQPHLAVVPTEQKQPQFKRSRFNSNPKQYDSKNNYLTPQQDPYSTQFAKFRQTDQQKDMFKSNQQRKILPQSDLSSQNPNGKAHQGSRPKLHGTYLKDQTSQLNKKRGQNTEEKKKRKGILNDYIRGKYMEG